MKRHTVGSSGNVEQRAFDLLVDGPLELCDACMRVPLYCKSIRQAFERLRNRGTVETVKVGGARLWFLVRDATRPVDRRGENRRRMPS